jgi:dihydropyrimidinase
MARAFDLVLRHARIATASDVYVADIGIQDGRITALGERLEAGAREIDVAGDWVLPGGIDAHCHLEQDSGDGTVMADDFVSGTRSAAAGGTTTIMPFACQIRGQSLRAAVDAYRARAAGRATIDYAFHLIVTDPTPQVLHEELPQLIAEGFTSFKIYMTYDDLKLDDRQILDVLSVARDEGAMTMIHAENGDCIAWLTERLLERGHQAPRFHGLSRPSVVEREATHRAISLSEFLDTPILIVHVSGREAAEQIGLAQQRGARILAETCPQYLFLTADDLEGLEGAKCICSPPPRDPHNQAAIWRGLANGVFQVFSSDHAPFFFEATSANAPACGGTRKRDATTFAHVPNGIPGLETRLPLLFSEGVMKQRIDINTFVALTATNPAKIYGLYPRKGTIAIGSDADLTVWSTGESRVIRNQDLHHNVDYTPYENMTVDAWPRLTLSRGSVVWDQASGMTGATSHGRLQPCDRRRDALDKRAARGTPAWLVPLDAG